LRNGKAPLKNSGDISPSFWFLTTSSQIAPISPDNNQSIFAVLSGGSRSVAFWRRPGPHLEIKRGQTKNFKETAA
jgi:hypothetical protein